MGKLETVFKSEISRLARHEMRPVEQSLRKQVRKLTRQVRLLSQQLARMSKTVGRAATARPALPVPVAEAEIEGARISAGLIQKLRKRLGITQSQLAVLAGVSAAAVQSWEQGIARPAGANKVAIVALRKAGRRDVAELLQKAGVAHKRKPRIGRPRKAAKARKPGRRTRKG